MNNISLLAIKYIKEHKKELIEKFADINKFPKSKYPFTIFMAGAPGVGKTETSKAFVEILTEVNNPAYVVRIDADEIKEFIPHYNHNNSDEVQGASALGVQKLFDHVTKKGIPALIDGTFCDKINSFDNVIRSIKHNRSVGIFYIYQDPIRAWELTVARGNKMGRYIPIDFFIDSLLKAKENVNEIKNKYSDKINLTVIQKNYDGGFGKFHINVANIDNYVKFNYNMNTLRSELGKIQKKYRK